MPVATHYQLRWRETNSDGQVAWDNDESVFGNQRTDFKQVGSLDSIEVTGVDYNKMYIFDIAQRFKSSTAYTVECRAQKEDEFQTDKSSWTPAKSIYTWPDRPVGVVQYGSKLDQIKMHFNKVSGEFVEYEIWYKVTDLNEQFKQYPKQEGSFEFAQDIASLELNDLPHDCRRYTVKVRATNPSPYSRDSEEVFMYTECPSPVITVHIEQTTPQKVCISWTKVWTDQVEYAPSYRFYSDNQVSFTTAVWQEQDNLNKCFEDMYPETHYQFRV